jgi:hypothetical protein
MTMQNFDQASERYKNACAMVELKEKLKREVPPIGSAFYRYFSDPNKNPPSYYSLVERIDNMSLASCKEHPMFDYYYSVSAFAIQ